MLSEREATAYHEAAHAVVGITMGLRVRILCINPPRWRVRFHCDAAFHGLSPRRRCMISMAGSLAEVRHSGELLCVPYEKILAELQQLQHGNAAPTSDTVNICPSAPA